ncbi:hypothetical protein C7445_10491 [Alicyclobacillus sacchari]|uniref:Uncharacterized protein n=2 Tax=Alicyclobacillus sacchari TaxID=392010 RepID=A0A4R8LPZ0_9BACL|nr:hypothetical protein [Alicyclobacillus sacchari]TDY49580.1 hypothetical protein C7445_10491 [Alicyclobacillus sacchari]
MTVSASHVYLYAATTGDLVKCFAAADIAGIPYANCTGNFQTAWKMAANASTLVIAVGGAALYSLYYNPCDWSNPAAMAGGHTPFELEPSGRGIAEARANYLVNAAGYTSLDSLTLAVMLAYYAVHGTFPRGYTSLPQQEVPQSVCVRGASPSVTTVAVNTTSIDPTSQVTAPSVGVYASFTTEAEVMTALQQGWPGIGVTAALGTQTSPYTHTLANQPDVLVAKALAASGSHAWWLSFWTVSWPQSGTTFYQAGYEGGVYAAQQIAKYPGSRRPNFVILDPEGYNSPATTAADFQSFINGFAAGVQSVNSELQVAFYANQWQYSTYQLAKLDIPAFIAIAPIAGNKPEVSGSNIKGYIAYYASCPAASYVAQVKLWGGLYNTVQFPDSGVDCSPV